MSGSFSVPQSTSGISKAPKFKPAIAVASNSRRPALPAFSTPGFQPPKARSNLMQLEPVYVSSDSAQSTPSRNSIKRQSSGFSIADSPPLKKSKRATNEKGHILPFSSKLNNLDDARPSRNPFEDQKCTGIALASANTLNQSEKCALKLRTLIAKERLAYNQGLESDGCDILYGKIETLIESHLKEIKTAKQQDTDTQKQTASHQLDHVIQRRECLEDEFPTSSHKENIAPANSACHIATIPRASFNDDDASEDNYWANMDDIIDTPVAGPTIKQRIVSPQQNNSGTLRSTSFYPEIKRQLRDVFKLTAFRTNQLEAITAALEGQDVFVLMPTGGGKSLCYQLPAICTTGKTKGVTVVVSPLLALMKDQVDSLQSKHVDAILSNSETVGEDWQRLMINTRKPQLWYVTPEKLRDSPKVNEILSTLDRDNNLARFVIDEAHCISTWGQDFRDAYTSLGSLRDKYPSVPIMALTATANKRTIADIDAQLKLKPGHASFTQSFNRINLQYTVRTKKGTPTNDIIDFISTRHRDETGVIYCTARLTCEKVAEDLRKNGLNASHFHAGMPTAEKDQTAHNWQTNAIRIIVATIAFGMGIDKADVRYVIHFDMPKSISGYYQETGRAGRDGKPAECLMFYSGSDLHKLRSQIRKSEGVTQESMQRQVTAVEEVFQFCRKTSVCRRVQLLRHFDEVFDHQNCNKGCDVCNDPRQPIPTDVTTHVRDTIVLLQRLVEEDGENVTFSQVAAVLRGSTAKDILGKHYDKYPEYGSCKKLSKELLDLIFDELLFQNIVTKVSTKNASGYHNEYLNVGDAAHHFLAGNRPVVLDWHPSSVKEPKARKTATSADSISAPVRSRKGKKIVEDDPIQESYDDMYDMDDVEPIFLNDIAKPHASTSSRPIYADVPRVSAPAASSSTIVTRAKVTAHTVQTEIDSEGTLYQKMLALRNEIMMEQNLHGSADVLEDEVLQYLSFTCPSDYDSFKRELMNGVEMEGAAAVDFANAKWCAFGQRFLRLCIAHKTGTPRSSTGINPTTPVARPAALLHARYEYQPPAGPSRTTSISSASVAKPKSKFKPSVPSS